MIHVPMLYPQLSQQCMSRCATEACCTDCPAVSEDSPLLCLDAIAQSMMGTALKDVSQPRRDPGTSAFSQLLQSKAVSTAATQFATPVCHFEPVNNWMLHLPCSERTELCDAAQIPLVNILRQSSLSGLLRSGSYYHTCQTLSLTFNSC